MRLHTHSQKSAAVIIKRRSRIRHETPSAVGQPDDKSHSVRQSIDILRGSTSAAHRPQISSPSIAFVTAGSANATPYIESHSIIKCANQPLLNGLSITSVGLVGSSQHKMAAALPSALAAQLTAPRPCRSRPPTARAPSVRCYWDWGADASHWLNFVSWHVKVHTAEHLFS